MDEQARQKQREANQRSYEKHKQERLAKRASASEEAKKSRSEYQRQWREKNREYLLEYDKRRWPERSKEQNDRARQNRKALPCKEKHRIDAEHWLKKRYSVSIAWYEAKLLEQGGHCALCPEVPDGRRLHIDHDHKCCNGKKFCGKCNRGLLCGKCNMLVGLLESEGWLQKAKDYLNSFYSPAVGGEEPPQFL